MAELKSCPFCGGSNVSAEYGYCDYGAWQVVCHNQTCAGMAGWADTKQEAIQAWNSRTEKES